MSELANNTLRTIGLTMIFVGVAQISIASFSKPDNPYDAPPEFATVTGKLQDRSNKAAWAQQPELVVGDGWPYYKLVFRDVQTANMALRYEGHRVKVTGMRVVHGGDWYLLPSRVEAVK